MFMCMSMSMYIMFVSVYSICIFYGLVYFVYYLCLSLFLLYFVSIIYVNVHCVYLQWLRCESISMFCRWFCALCSFLWVFSMCISMSTYIILYCHLIMCIVYLSSICMFMMFISMSMFISCLLYLLITCMHIMCIFSVYLPVTFFVLSVLCIL